MKNDLKRIATWLQPQEILLDVDVSDQADALKFISSAVGRGHGLDADTIFRVLSRREQAASTALGGGFAIPHARIAGIDRPLTLFIRSRRGIAFHAPDGKPVSDLLAIMVPMDGDKNDHLQLLALVVRLFSDRALRVGLEGARDVDAAKALFQNAIMQISIDES